MADKKKPLPEPPSGPFGRKKTFGENDEPSLLADRIARAVAEGKIDELMGTEIPDSEHARKLVSMMMGMTGLSMPGDFGTENKSEITAGEKKKAETGGEVSPAAPPDVVEATRQADVEGLKKLLEREQEARSSDKGAKKHDGKAVPPEASLSLVEKDVMDRLIGIAEVNGLTIDWLILRALRLYVGEYDKTGRL